MKIQYKDFKSLEELKSKVLNESLDIKNYFQYGVRIEYGDSNKETFAKDIQLLENKLAEIEKREPVEQYSIDEPFSAAKRVHTELLERLVQYAVLNAKIENVGMNTGFIHIEEDEDGTLLINVPFDLKDNFKENFSTAKWNGEIWTLKRRTVRLEEWIYAANVVYSEQKNMEYLQDFYRLRESDYNKIENVFGSKKRELKKALSHLMELEDNYNSQVKKYKSETAQIEADLEIANAKIHKLETSLETEKSIRDKALKELNAQNKEILLHYIDIDEMLEAKKSIVAIFNDVRRKKYLDNDLKLTCLDLFTPIELALNKLRENDLVWVELKELYDIDITKYRKTFPEEINLNSFTLKHIDKPIILD